MRTQKISGEKVVASLGGTSFMTETGKVIQGDWTVGDYAPVVFDKPSRRYLPVWKRHLEQKATKTVREEEGGAEPPITYPVIGVMAQHMKLINHETIFFESQDKDKLEHIYIDLMDVLIYDEFAGCRMIKLCEDEAWAGLIVFHQHNEPYQATGGTYRVVVFRATTPVVPEVRWNKPSGYDTEYPPQGKYRKYNFEYKTFTVPDWLNATQRAFALPVEKTFSRTITNFDIWTTTAFDSFYTHTPHGRFGCGWHVDEFWCEYDSTWKPCGVYIDMGMPLGTVYRDPISGEYGFYGQHSCECWGVYYCGDVGQSHSCIGEQSTFYYSDFGNTLIVGTPHVASWDENAFVYIIGARVWWNNTPFQDRPFANIKYELVASTKVHITVPLTVKYTNSFSPGAGDCAIYQSRILPPGGEHVAWEGDYWGYDLQLVVRTQGVTWGAPEDPIGYTAWHILPLPLADSYQTVLNFGGCRLFWNAGGILKGEERINNLYECFFTAEGVPVYLFSTFFAAGYYGYGGPEMPDEYKNKEGVYAKFPNEDAILIADNDYTNEKEGEFKDIYDYLAPIWYRPGTFYTHTMQKGFGINGRKMLRTVANNMLYRCGSKLYKKQDRGTVWDPKSPPMTSEINGYVFVNNAFGPVSKEMVLGWNNIRVPVCDSTFFFDYNSWPWFAVVTLVGKQKDRPNIGGVSKFLTNDYDTMSFGTGYLQADYSVRMQPQQG